jgi:purine-binding chemotaxis protein CheW
MTTEYNSADYRQFATFRLDNIYLGVPVLEVQEVIRYQEMTRVPLAPSMVRGLINLRGQIVTAIDLRQRLQLPPRKQDALPMNMVIRTDEGAVSLLVDEIDDVIEVSRERHEPPPVSLSGLARELLAGVYKLDSRLLLILNTEKAISLPNSYYNSGRQVA